MTLKKMERSLTRGTEVIEVSNLMDVVGLINLNVDSFGSILAKLTKKLRKTKMYSVIAIVGVAYAIAKSIKHDEELDKLHFRLNELENKEEE